MTLGVDDDPKCTSENSHADLGVIVPPPSVRTILEKTASAVGKKPQLERLIFVKHADDSKFSFLHEADPFHAYYREKVEEARAELPEKTSALDSDAGAAEDIKRSDSKSIPGSVSASQEVAPSLSKLNAERLRAEKQRPLPEKPPPDDVFSVPDTSPMPSNLALDVIKLVAEFDVRCGREFTMTLASREYRNHLFDFLQPTHPHFFIFQRLVEAYNAIIRPAVGRDDILATLAEEAASRSRLFKRVWYDHDWRQLKETDDSNAGGSLMDGPLHAQIDWHDFVVAETVDIDESDEDLPAPLPDPEQIPRVMAAADAARKEWESNRVDVDMDIDVDPDTEPNWRDDDIASRRKDVVTADVEADIPAHRVLSAPPISQFGGSGHQGGVYGGSPRRSSSKLSERAADSRHLDGGNIMISARLPDGEIVPISETNPAIGAKLVNPKYKEERMRAAESHIRQNLASGEEIARNLARLNRDKLDTGVYNKGDLQGSLADIAMNQASSRKPIALSKATVSGPRLPDASTVDSSEHDDVDSQPLKRAKVEAAVDALSSAAAKNQDSIPAGAPLESSRETVSLQNADKLPGLLSESDWIQKVGEKVEICVRVPVHPSKDWQLEGQEINVEVPLRKSVADLKDVLAKCVRLPTNKQKLQFGNAGFMKDRMSLASYNIPPGGTIHLEVKERGGRSKK